MNYSIFIPVRKGSERLIKKNTRDFAGISGGLLSLKLSQLVNLTDNYEIVVSTNDEDCFVIANSFRNKIKNLRVVERAEELGRSSTPLSLLIKHAGAVCSGKSVLWTHVTSPFCNSKEYKKAIKLYEELDNGYDSLVSGRDYKEFLLDKSSGKLVNNTSQAWPRTQDLPDWFEINNAIFLTSREKYIKGKRTGAKPMLHTQNRIVSLDIDYEEDFKIAEAVYDRFYR